MNNDTENLIKAADVAPVLDQVSELLEEVIKSKEASDQRVTELEAQLAAKDKVILEKVAAAKNPVFTDEAIQETMQALKDLNIIDDAMAAKYASDIRSNPRAILPMLTKISAALITTLPETEGEGVAKEAAANSDPADPDGWGAMAAGRPVQLVR